MPLKIGHFGLNGPKIYTLNHFFTGTQNEFNALKLGELDDITYGSVHIRKYLHIRTISTAIIYYLHKFFLRIKKCKMVR